MKIVKLEAENIKALRAVEIEPDGSLVQIAGRNGQGKSSVLDSIFWALAGAKHADSVPIRTGQTRARIRLDLGEIVVTRHFAERDGGDVATRLTVETAEGARFPSPQALLDGLLGSLTFDPLAFSRLDAGVQYRRLSELVGVDLAADEAANRADFDRRRDVNRRAKAARAQAEGIVVPDGTPAEPVSVSALVQQVRDAEAGNRELDGERARRERETQRAGSLRDTAALETQRAADVEAETQRAVDDLLARIETIKIEGAQRAARHAHAGREAAKQADAVATELAALPPVEPDTDTTPLQERIEQAETTNQAVARAVRRLELTDEADAAEAESKRLTEAMDARRADMRARVEAADMPVDGLGMADGAVTLRGIPLAQASDAEKLDVSCAIAMRQDAKLKVLRIREGSTLDTAARARIAAMAAELGWQVWMECVDESGKIGIVIEAGEVVRAVGADEDEIPPQVT